MFGYVYKLGDQWDRGQTDESLIRYILGLSNVSRQGKIFNTVPKKAYVTSTFADRKILEFKIELAANTFTNYRRTCIVLPLTIKKATNKAQGVDVITVNNLFCHLQKQIDVRRYPDDGRMLPTNKTVVICQYAAQQLKHLSKKSLRDIRKTLLYEKSC